MSESAKRPMPNVNTDAARGRILASVRKQKLKPQAAPDADGPWIEYPDPVAVFEESLRSVGGDARHVEPAQLADVIKGLEPYQQGKLRLSTVEIDGLEWTLDVNHVDDPHQLEEVDFAVLSGEFCVAENGAIWVTDRNVRQRTVYFITQHLALVVPRDAVVSNMHQAYERLRFDDNAFGCFISGPSKTADIEQSLVIGAHGARSLTVLLT